MNLIFSAAVGAGVCPVGACRAPFVGAEVESVTASELDEDLDLTAPIDTPTAFAATRIAMATNPRNEFYGRPQIFFSCEGPTTSAVTTSFLSSSIRSCTSW